MYAKHNSRKPSSALILCGSLAIGAIILLLLNLDDFEQEIALRDSQDDAPLIQPTRSHVPAQVEHAKTPRPNRPTTATFELRDTLTDEVLPNCEVLLTNGQKVISSKDGRFETEFRDARTMKATVILSEDFGSRGPIPLELKYLEEFHEDPQQLKIPAFSAIEAICSLNDVSKIHVELFTCPKLEDLPFLEGLDRAERESFWIYAAHPESLWMHLNRLCKGGWPKSKGVIEGKQRTIYTKCSGRTAIVALPETSHGSHMMVHTSFCELEPGVVTPLDLSLRERPIVSGVVLDMAGNPLSGASVVIRSRWTYGEDSPIPVSRQEPNSPGMGIWGKKGQRVATVELKRTRKSDNSGKFEIPMPFTGEVAVCVNKLGYRAGYAEPAPVSPDSTPEPVEIRLAERLEKPKHTIRVVYNDGTPASGVLAELTTTLPNRKFDRVFNLLANTKGIIDSSDLNLGASVLGFIEHKHPVNFVQKHLVVLTIPNSK